MSHARDMRKLTGNSAHTQPMEAIIWQAVTSLSPRTIRFYVVAEEIRIPEDAIKDQAIRWLEKSMICKAGEEPKLTDSWISTHTEDFKSVDDLLIFIRYTCTKTAESFKSWRIRTLFANELATRWLKSSPKISFEGALNDANVRLEEMIARNGMTLESFSQQRGITVEQVYADVKERTLQSLREDSALEAYATHRGIIVEPEDYYDIIPGDSIQDKARKRRQIEMQGRLAQMEEYARKTKALKKSWKTR